MSYKEQNYSGHSDPDSKAEMLSKYREDIVKWNELVATKAWLARYSPRTTICTNPSHHGLVANWKNCGRERTFDAKWREFIPHREWFESDGVTTELCVVDRCFRLSKYRDIATVERLFRGSRLALVQQLIAGCDDKELR